MSRESSIPRYVTRTQELKPNNMIQEIEALLPLESKTRLRGRRSIYCWSSCWIFLALLTLNLFSMLIAYSYGRLEAYRAFSEDPDGIEEVYKSVDRSLKTRAFSTFDPFNNRSRFTARPGPDVDNAWDEIGAGKSTTLLPLKFGHIFGLDPQHYFHVRPPQWGDHREGYAVQFWATHDLHCVNQLRKSLYYNHDYYKARGAHLNETEEEHRSHINHCIDILRERVMCTADARVIPTAWGPGEFDFATKRKCHDYDSLLAWVNKHKLTEEDRADPLVRWDRVEIPSDAVFGAAGYHLVE